MGYDNIPARVCSKSQGCGKSSVFRKVYGAVSVSVRVSSCHDVRVTARLWFCFSRWRFCRESDWTGLVLEPELEIALSVRKFVKAG